MTNHEQKAYEAMALQLTEAGYSYENVTYGNDVTASISVSCVRIIGKEVQVLEFTIFIPNCDYFDPDNEFFNTYAVKLESTGHTYDFDRADEVVEYIQTTVGDTHITNITD